MASHKKLDKPITAAPIQEVTAIQNPKGHCFRLVVQVSVTDASAAVMNLMKDYSKGVLSRLDKEHFSIVKLEQIFILDIATKGK